VNAARGSFVSYEPIFAAMTLQLHDIDSELANTFGSFLRRHGVIVGVTLTLEQHPGLSLSPFSA
jgi:hypothetical protein